MSISGDNLAVIISAIAVLLGAYATYRNSTRKNDLDRLQQRVNDLEKRAADAEKRANDSERKVIEYRNDMIKIGEQIDRERREGIRRLAALAIDANAKINRVVLVLRQMALEFEAQIGHSPEVDIDALEKMVRIDNVTGPLGPIDLDAVRRLNE